jgi:hypothetical protein
LTRKKAGFVPLRKCELSLPQENKELTGFWENLLTAVKKIAENTFSVKQGQSMIAVGDGIQGSLDELRNTNEPVVGSWVGIVPVHNALANAQVLSTIGGIYVKATFILLTAVWAAGQQPDAAPAPAPAPAPGPAPVIAGPGCNNCGSDCGNYYYNDDCCREGFLSKFKNRIGGLFNRGGGCCDQGHSSCNTCTTNYTTTCNTSSSCCQHKSVFNSGCDSGCDCGGSKWSFGSRLRGLFNRKSTCCDSGCDSGCNTYGSGGVIVAPHTGAPAVVIPPAGVEEGPKKMPMGDKNIETKPIDNSDLNPTEPAPIGAAPFDANPVAGPIPISDPDLGIAPPSIAPNIPLAPTTQKTPF